MGSDVEYFLEGTQFIWNAEKAASNERKHGVSFEQAAAVFFDPLFRIVDAAGNYEARDAIIGFDAASRVLFVVHIQVDSGAIRIISARVATKRERQDHEHF
jgi:uncharacterized DUF497 family protein